MVCDVSAGTCSISNPSWDECQFAKCLAADAPQNPFYFDGIALVTGSRCYGVSAFAPYFFLALTSFPGAPIVLVLIAACIIVYFGVRWSLYNQCIIIEGLTAKAAFRRSSELVQGKWWAFFGRYLLLIWVSGVLTGLIFAITLILLSIANSEFVIIRETLLSERFIMLFFGIDIAFTFNGEAFVFGDIAATLDSRPSFWMIGVILVVKTLLCAAFEPIWAILTTHLYLQRTGEPDLVSE